MDPNDIVRHKSRKEWGLGKVLNVSSNGEVEVYFLEAGLKKLSLKVAVLEKVTGPEANHPRLTNLDPSGKEEALSVETAIEIFLGKFPEGFNDPLYFEQERNYKLNTARLCHELLSKGSLESLLHSASDSAWSAARKVLASSNMLSTFETIKLNDAMKGVAAAKQFGKELNALLYGEQELKSRFEAFVRFLDEHELAKWPVATFFLFFQFSKDQMFVKPTVTQALADAFRFQLGYRPHPNWTTYKQVLDLAGVIDSELRSKGTPELEPRDMIDVQSFMWAVSPVALKIDAAVAE